MDIKTQEIAEIEKKLWQLVLLAIVIILFLTLCLLGYEVVKYVRNPEEYTSSGQGYLYAISLAIFILMFCSYLIVQPPQAADGFQTALHGKDVNGPLGPKFENHGFPAAGHHHH